MSVRTFSLPCLLALLPLALLLPGAKQDEAPGVITGRVVEWKEDPIPRTTRGGRSAARPEPDAGDRKGGPIAGATVRLQGPAPQVIV